MFHKPHKLNQYRRKGKNLIATNKIKPEQWHISEAEAKEALKAKGYDGEVLRLASLKPELQKKNNHQRFASQPPSLCWVYLSLSTRN